MCHLHNLIMVSLMGERHSFAQYISNPQNIRQLTFITNIPTCDIKITVLDLDIFVY